MVKTLTDQNSDTILNQEKPVVVKCWATWCGPCRAFGPIFENVSNDDVMADTYDFYSLDVDNEEYTAEKLGVRSLPTTLIYKAGQEIAKISGMKSDDALTEWLIVNEK